MRILTDDVLIFETLSESKMEIFDPLHHQAFAFWADETWYLFLFNPSGPMKGCRMYLLEKSGFEMELREQLLPELLSLTDNHDYVILKNKALVIVESLISTGKGDHLFFDAH